MGILWTPQQHHRILKGFSSFIHSVFGVFAAWILPTAESSLLKSLADGIKGSHMGQIPLHIQRLDGTLQQGTSRMVIIIIMLPSIYIAILGLQNVLSSHWLLVKPLWGTCDSRLQVRVAMLRVFTGLKQVHTADEYRRKRRLDVDKHVFKSFLPLTSQATGASF